MTQINSYKITVQEKDLDFTGRPRFTMLCGMILDVAGLDANVKGCGISAISEQDHTWVISRMAVEWARLPESFEQLEIKTWVSTVNRLMSTRNFSILDAAGEQIGVCSTLWAMIDINTRQAVDLREHYRALIVDVPAPIMSLRKMPKPDPVTTELSHTICYSDIDFNNHTNTLRYIELMCNTLPLEWFEKHFIKRFDVHFLEEARYGEVLKVQSQITDSAAHFDIKNFEQKSICSACIAF